MSKLNTIRHFLLFLFILAIQPSQATTGFSKVFVQCAVAQGNGFNWASTVGWLSATAWQMANAADKWEKSNEGAGKKAGVDLSCFTGSSSSGFTTALLDHLLHNQNLVPGNNSRARKILTVQQAFDISDALYYLALSMDFNVKEKAITGISAIGARIGHQEESSHTIEGNFWSASADVSQVTKLFRKWITAADYYHQDWLNQKKDIRKFVSMEIQGKPMVNLPMADDFCVTAFVIPVTGPNFPLPFDDLKVLYICNSATVKRIKSGTSMTSLLSSGKIMKDKFMIGSTDSWSVAQNITVREPDLLTELSGRLTQDNLVLNNAFEFANGKFRNANLETKYLIFGGFPDPRMQSWAGTVLLKKRMAELKKAGYSVLGRMAIFGKTENRKNADYSFAQKTMVKYFTLYHQVQNHKEQIPAVQSILGNYYAWQDDYCRSISRVENILFDFFRMDWNLEDRPAAFIGRSQELALKGFHLVKTPVDCKL